jgi:GNAT superfamily N-acetyltransferase
MSLATTASDLRCRVRRDGPRELLRKGGARLRARLYSSSEVIVLKKDLADVTGSSQDLLRIEDFDASHLPALREFNRRRCFSKADVRAVRALERGYRGFVGYVGHELVGYYWWVDGAIEPRHSDIVNLGLDIELGPGEVYGYDFFLLEDHRGDGKSMEFLAKIETALRARGYRILWGYVVSDNRPARWTYGLRGYESVRKVASRTVLGRRHAQPVLPG